MRTPTFIKGTSAGYAAGRYALGSNASIASANLAYRLGFNVGKISGQLVRVSKTAITFIGAGVKLIAQRSAQVAKYLASKTVAAVKVVINNVPLIASKILEGAKVVGIKLALAARALGQKVVGAAKSTGRFFKTAGEDIKDYFKDVKKFTKNSYDVAAKRLVNKRVKHSNYIGDPTEIKGLSKARIAYDSFAKGRVLAKRSRNMQQAKNPVNQAIRNFKNDFRTGFATVVQKATDAILVGAGIAGAVALITED